MRTFDMLDASGNNGLIDWPKVLLANPSIKRVMIKASEGVGYEDLQFKNNVTSLKENKIPMGFYHFATLNINDGGRDAIAEAKWFDHLIRPFITDDTPVVLDIETNEVKMNPAAVEQWIESFWAILTELGYKSLIIYSYKNFLDQNLPVDHKLGDLPLWLAAWCDTLTSDNLPNGWSKAWAWQFTNEEKSPSFAGAMDASVVLEQSNT